MSSIKKRLERLERARPRGFAILIVQPGETEEEAWQRHLAQHPEDEEAEGIIILAPLDQGLHSGPPPPRPQPPKRPGVAGPRPLQITK